MLKVAIINVLVLLSTSANATNYECTLSDGTNTDPHAVKYKVDTATEDNIFIDLGNGVAVGCVVLRTTPQLMTCGIGDGVNFSLAATTEDGSSVLALDSNSRGDLSSLKCVKYN